MTTISDVCESIYDLVRRIGSIVNNDDDIHGGGSVSGLTEQARLLHRLLRRLEVAISGCEPYLRGVRVWGPLKEVDSVLSALLQALRDAACKGRLVGYLTADRVLARFTAAACRLDLALARLQDETRGGPPVNSGSSSGSSSSLSGSSSSFSSGGAGAGGNGNGNGAGGVWLPAEAQEELASVRQLLQRARFALPPAHGHTLGRYRAAADGLAANWGVLLEACGGVLQATLQAPLLSRRVFEEALSELQAEAQLQQYVAAQLQQQPQQQPQPQPQSQQRAGAPPLPPPPPPPHPVARSAAGGVPLPGSAAAAATAATAAAAARAEQDAQYLRVLMDVVRAHHAHPDCDAPLEFLCPLTHRLMQEPVLLHDTGHSYDRSALEGWWAAGHRFCPRTGVPLRRLNTSPNHNLRSAIERWQLHCEMQLSFRPVIDTLVTQQLQQQKQQCNKQQQQAQKQPHQLQQSQGVQKQQGGAASSLEQRAVGLAERLQRLAVLEAPLEDAAPAPMPAPVPVPVPAAVAAAVAAPAVQAATAGCVGPAPPGPTDGHLQQQQQQQQPRLQSQRSDDQELSAGLLRAAAAVVAAAAAAGAGAGGGAGAVGAQHAYSWGGVPLDVRMAAAVGSSDVPAAMLCFSDGGAANGCLGAAGRSGSASSAADSPHLDTPQRAGSAQLGVADCDVGGADVAAAVAVGYGSGACGSGAVLRGGPAQHGLVPATAVAVAAAAAPGGLVPGGGSGSLISFSSIGATMTPVVAA